VVATGVAELLADMAGALEAHRKRLRTLLDHWTDRGTWCEKDAMKVNGGHCPKCNQVPPSPRACLVELLGDLRELSNEELLSLEGDPRTDVADKARKVLVRRVNDEPAIVDWLVDLAISSEVSIRVLSECLESTGSGATFRDGVGRLLRSDRPELRLVAGNCLATNGWPHEHAVNLAHELRADSNPAVRTCGVRQLRALRLQ
jgi:hypothetical protein